MVAVDDACISLCIMHGLDRSHFSTCVFVLGWIIYG